MVAPPLISVITVTFNAEKVIGKTLKSLKNQSFRDFEHIVVDGASTDQTLELVRKSGKSVVLSEPDNGLYDAMNKGLKLAKGRYVIFLNAGDSFHSENTLEKYGKEASTGVDIIYGDTDIVDLTGAKISRRHLSAPAKLTKKSFSEGMLICHQAFMVKKDLAPKYDIKYKFSADYDWCVKCIENSTDNNHANLKEVTIDYLSDGLTDKNKWKSLKERFLIMARHYGLPVTLAKHFSFIFRALRRGSF